MSPNLHGRTIRVVSPGRWTKPEALTRFAALIGGFGAKVDIDPQCSLRDGQLAGDDPARAAVFNAALADSRVDVIWCARGGYGASRILGAIDWRVASPGKILIGHSDVTLLHQQALRAGVTPIHGAMPIDTLSDEKLDNVVRAAEIVSVVLQKAIRPAAHFDLKPVRPGHARGKLDAGNLSVLTNLIGTPFEPDWRGVILCVEDINEYFYALDRLFVHLSQSRLAQGIAGLVLGEFLDSKESDVAWGKSVEEMAAQHFPNIPIATGLPIGHGAHNRPLILGQEAVLDVSDAAALAVKEEKLPALSAAS
jgi:muramoyltetrapeptide carboxypeptidase